MGIERQIHLSEAFFIKRMQGFVAGLLTAAIIMAGGVTALAAGNGWDITVYPIKVLVYFSQQMLTDRRWRYSPTTEPPTLR